MPRLTAHQCGTRRENRPGNRPGSRPEENAMMTLDDATLLGHLR
jgi:hypothetical protein